MISFNSICTKDDLRLLKKYSLSVKIKKDSLTEVIDSLLDIDLSTLDSSSARLVNKDLDYLERLNIKNDIDVMLKSKVNENLILVEPLSIFAIRVLEPDRVVSFDIKDILKALAFRHLHYEFGYKVTDIEEYLKDTKMVIRNKPDSLLDLVNRNIDSFKLLRDFKITDLSYVSNDKSYINDHFSNKINVKDNYNPVLQSTFAYANLFSNIEICKQFSELELLFKPLGSFGTNIYFLMGSSNDIEKLSDINIVLEVFGRKFKFDLDFTLGGSLENVD